MMDKNLVNLLGKDKKYIALITITNIFAILASVASTAFICLIIYYAVTNTGTKSKYIMYFALTVVSILVIFALTLFNGRLKTYLGNSVKENIRSRIYKKIMALGINGNTEKHAAITQMSIEGVEQLDLYYSAYMQQFFCALIAPFIIFLICVAIEARVALVLFAGLPLIPISIILVSKYAKRIFAKYWGKYTSMGDSFLDNVQGLKDLKIFNCDEIKQIESGVKAEEFRKVTMKVLVMQLVSITIMDLVAFGGAAVAIVLSIQSGRLERIAPIAALFLILISSEIFIPMRQLGSVFHVSMNGATAGKKIITFLELEEKQWGSEIIEKAESISLDKVHFSYDKERQIIKDVSMNFNKGLNSVVGKSGSGKSTIVSLILGSYSVDSGTINLNGKEIHSFNRDSYYKKISLVSHNTFIFNTSIRENFKLAKEDVTDSEIYAALEKVNLKEFVEEMGGLDYVILESSENISGGQRQRIALAVNLIVEKDIYIFDEATSNIDIESDMTIMSNIKNLAKEKVVILISHRLQNVKESNIIYMLADGEISESGSHEDLIKLNGAYSVLYNEQYELENGYKEDIKNA